MAQSTHIPRRIVDIRIGESSGVAQGFGDRDKKQPWCWFKVMSWMEKKPNEAKVKITNLSESTINSLERPGLVLQINAGFDVPGLLFRGSISKDGVATTNQGQDWITEISAADGRRAYRDALFTETYPPAYPVISILNAIAVAMNKPLTIASTIAPQVRTQLNSVKTPTGWTFSEKARDALDRILGPFGLSWGIVSGVVYIFDPFVPLPGNAPLITPTGGGHGSPKRTKKGINLPTDLDPRIQTGRAFAAQFRMVRGEYIAEQVEHEGDSDGTVWRTQAKGRKV
jgi:hypothetical protein